MDMRRKISKFKEFMGKNWQWAIPLFSLVCGAVWNVLLYPLCAALWAFILTTSASNADVKVMKPKVTALETVVYSLNGKVDTIIKQNDLLLNGRYRDIKEYVEKRENSSKP